MLHLQSTNWKVNQNWYWSTVWLGIVCSLRPLSFILYTQVTQVKSPFSSTYLAPTTRKVQSSESPSCLQTWCESLIAVFRESACLSKKVFAKAFRAWQMSEYQLLTLEHYHCHPQKHTNYNLAQTELFQLAGFVIALDQYHHWESSGQWAYIADHRLNEKGPFGHLVTRSISYDSWLITHDSDCPSGCVWNSLGTSMM